MYRLFATEYKYIIYFGIYYKLKLVCSLKSCVQIQGVTINKVYIKYKTFLSYYYFSFINKYIEYIIFNILIF